MRRAGGCRVLWDPAWAQTVAFSCRGRHLREADVGRGLDSGLGVCAGKGAARPRGPLSPRHAGGHVRGGVVGVVAGVGDLGTRRGRAWKAL